MAPTYLAEIEDLVGYFQTMGGDLHVLDGATVRIEEGKVTGLVGETGSGKTVTALSLLRLWPSNFRHVSGSVTFRGEDVLALKEDELRNYRGRTVSIAFQDPKAALNPVFTVGEQLGRVLRRHAGVSKEAAYAEVISLLRDLVDDMGLTVLLITHDLGVVGELCDNVAVMYAGKVMEFGDIADVFEYPANPYTRELLRSTESVEGGVGDLYSIPGTVPDLRFPPGGCTFRERCPRTGEECTEEPDMIEVAPGHHSACHFALSVVREPTPVHFGSEPQEGGRVVG